MKKRIASFVCVTAVTVATSASPALANWNYNKYLEEAQTPNPSFFYTNSIDVSTGDGSATVNTGAAYAGGGKLFRRDSTFVSDSGVFADGAFAIVSQPHFGDDVGA